eukprot:TRINITY_DN64466_c0_g1_i1.p1 TRINITY_DN64466_c0_g1~~TRINITY_DN64466_c0_g1_i1.p1  ORF type:complete len:222 (+),score=41.24 TRINITY_DN64466_c0_g1_i1:1-666(+)
MAINLQPMSDSGGFSNIPGDAAGFGGAAGGSGGVAGAVSVLAGRASALAQSVAAALPGSLAAVPGDPVVAKQVGTVAGGALLFATLMGLFGVFTTEASAISHVSNFYAIILSALAVIMQAEPSLALPERVIALREIILAQARILGTFLGLAGLHLIMTTLTLAQGSVAYILLGLPSLLATALHGMVWHQRSMADTGDDTGLVHAQLSPMPGDPRNFDASSF